MPKVKVVMSIGERLPGEVSTLTRGPKDGVMLNWYYNHKDNMIAALLYEDNRLVAWACVIEVKKFLFFKTDILEVSTYVHKSFRRKGYGKKVLSMLLKLISWLKPHHKIRYGAPEETRYFDETYKSLISKYNLIPIKYYE